MNISQHKRRYILLLTISEWQECDEVQRFPQDPYRFGRPAMPPKQTLWSETCVYVTKSLRLNKVLAHKVPSRITFTADDNKIFFLAGSGRSCLYSVNLEQGSLTLKYKIIYEVIFETSAFCAWLWSSDSVWMKTFKTFKCWYLECEDIEKPMEQTQFFDNPHVPISREEEVSSWEVRRGRN